MNEPRVSDAELEQSIIKQGEYFASWRPGSLGKEGAKHGWDALLDLRDARARIQELEAALRECRRYAENNGPIAERARMAQRIAEVLPDAATSA